MRIQGNLATYEFSDLLQWLAQGNKTGVLTVADGAVEYQLGFDHGRIDMSSSSDPKQRLDNYLFEKGVIDEATLARAERLRDATKMMSGQVLVTLGAVSESQLAQALREKTERILCELLTWDQGTFEFEGGDRPESSMVPINLEVTKLLLESMHRLDQERGGQPPPPAIAVEPTEPAPAPRPVAFTVPEPARPAASPEATQAIEGLALAEVLDPEEASRQDDAGGAPPVEMPGEMPANYAAMTMAQSPGPLRRLAPYALLMVLSLAGATFYLANRDGTAQAADVAPSGPPILFTQTEGPRPVPAAMPADPAPPAQPAGGAIEDSELLRQRYEEELANLRRELEEARRDSRSALAETPAAPARGDVSDLPADAMVRAAVTPQASSPPAGADAAPPSLAALRSAARPAPPPAEPETTPAPPAAPPADEPQVSPAAATALELVNPKLLDRPMPRYPAAARRHGRGASVVVRVLVGPDGRVQQVEKVGPKAGLGFDRAAEEAARASTWLTGTRNGEPTAMWAELRFEFRP